MVVVPALTTVTVPPEVTVATPGALLVYVIAPSLLLVGAVRSNAASPKFLAGAVRAPMEGAARATFNVPLVELAA
jgi:hypothetical protein